MRTLSEQIGSREREIAMRKRVYPRWVENKKMSAQKAEHEIQCMEAVLQRLRMSSYVSRP